MAPTFDVELSAYEPANVDRKRFPLTVGVPFAPGVLSESDSIAIENIDGSLRPVQKRVTETHKDGSVRWLLVDYQTDMKPLQFNTCRLHARKEAPVPEAGNRIETREDGDTLTINNGVLEIQVDRARCRPLISVKRDGEVVSEGGLDFWITSDKGVDFRALNDDEAAFEFEEQGPLRTAMTWKGTHKDDKGNGHFDFEVRLTVYAGQSFVRVDHIFTNRLDDPVTHLKQLVARLPYQAAGERLYAAAGGFWHYDMHPSEKPLRLEIYEAGDYRVLGGDGSIIKDKRPRGSFCRNSMGWVDVSTNDQGVMLAGKSFWQNYPKAIDAGADAIDCYLIPDRGDGFDVPRGMAKMHTFYPCFHRGRSEKLDPCHLAATMHRWPHPAAPSQYYQDTGAFWDYVPYYPDKYPRLEVAIRDFFEPDPHNKMVTPPVSRAFGLKHYGDFVQLRNEERVGGSGQWEVGPDPDAPDTYYHNNEYDTQHVLAMMFLRTGEITKWWTAEAHAQHAMDVDTCHHVVAAPPNEMLNDWRVLINCQYRHCYQHVGGIQKPETTHHVAGEGSHTFTEGILDYYRLTGERRALDIATNYARHLAFMVNELDYSWSINRSAGWGLLVLGGVYEIRPEPEIEKAAERLIELSMNDKRTDLDDRNSYLFLRGACKWHRASGSETARKFIIELTDRSLSQNQSKEGLVFYGSWPEFQRHIWPMVGYANLETLAYCYDLTGDRKYIDAGVATLCQAIDWVLNPQMDKGLILFARMMHGPFRFMAIAHDLGILERINVAGHWLIPQEQPQPA